MSALRPKLSRPVGTALIPEADMRSGRDLGHMKIETRYLGVDIDTATRNHDDASMLLCTM